MDIQVTDQAITEIACDALVIGVSRQKGDKQARLILSETTRTVESTLGGLITELGTDGEFKGGLGELATIHTMGKMAAKRVIVAGLGSQEKISTQAFRRGGAIAARHLQQTGARHIARALDCDDTTLEDAQVVQAQVEGALLGLYRFRKYQRSDENGKGMTTIICPA